MSKSSAPLALLLASSLVLSSLARAAPTFRIGDQVLTLPTVTQGGQTYVQLAALAKALGYALSYDAGAQRYTLTPQAVGATGSGQLAGGAGAPGKPYSVTDNYNGKLNFTLRSAEVVATRVNIGSQSLTPAAGEKLLIVRYSVQNADKTDQRAYFSSFRLSLVDDQNQTLTPEETAGREGGSDVLDVQLKPAQKVDGYQVFRLPAAASVPKLLVQGAQNTLIRYDLRGVAKPPTAPYADPQNAQAVRASVPAAPGATFQVGAFDVRLDRAVFSSAALAGQPPAGGHRYLVLTLSVHNSTPGIQRLTYFTLKPTLRLAGGDRADWNGTLLKAGSDEPLDVRLNPGEETGARLYFDLPGDAAPQVLSLVQENSRPIDFDVSSVR